MLSAQNPEVEWNTIRVDTQLELPTSYGPPDLHNISDAGFPFTEGLALRGFVMAGPVEALREGAAANGTPIKILAAYRSYPTQEDLFARRVDELGASEAGSRVARPGHSEHQLGTTIDITSEGATDVDQSWGASPAGQWIAEPRPRVRLHPELPERTRSERTCYDFEPWHLRYVGPRQRRGRDRAGHHAARVPLEPAAGRAYRPRRPRPPPSRESSAHRLPSPAGRWSASPWPASPPSA